MYNNGLILEGGGTRAIYASGVLDAFLDNDLKFDYVIGASAGACNGVSYLGKNKYRMRDITLNYVNDKRYMGMECLLKGGQYLNTSWIFGELCYELMPLNQEEFENSGATFCVVTTSASKGIPKYFYVKNMREWGCKEVKASCSLPFATKPVKIDNDAYFDGGLVDSIPIQKAISDGCKKAVVVLTQHKGYIKKQISPTICSLLKTQYPQTAKALANRHNMYNEQLQLVDQLESEGKIFVVRPSESLNCPTLEKSIDKLKKIYQIGYDDATKRIDDLHKYLNR